MNKKSVAVFSTITFAALVVAIPGIYAQTAAGDFKAEPDKSLAAAHESFV